MNLNIKLSESRMNCLKREAEQFGLTPNMLARMQLSLLYSPHETEDAERAYIIRVKKWREIEAYINVKYPGVTIGDFLEKIAVFEMKRCPLKPTQKEEFDRLLGK